MFTAKQSKLLEKKQPTSGNIFVATGLKKAIKKTTALGNGAVKLVSTGNEFVDDFGKASNYRVARTYAEVEKTMSVLWGENPHDALKIAFYMRMITRKVQLPNGERTADTQRGQGLKHEGIFRMLWLAINQPKTFWKNLSLFIAVGSWKDIFTMLSYDLQFHGWKGRQLDWTKMGKVIVAGLENPNTNELIKKYMPTIRASSKCITLESQADTMVGKWLCSVLFGVKEGSPSTYKEYRLLKSSGTAHQWQQLISRHKLLKIDFSTIHGRALAQLVSGKFLKNHNLEEKYTNWLEKQPIVKYTGYVYEIFATIKKGRATLNSTKYQRDTVDKQFMQLIETAKQGLAEGDNFFLAVIDTSGSMDSEARGTKVSSYDVAKAMALYCSYLLKGPFADCFFEFTDGCILKKWKGSTPTEKIINENSYYVGGTNFQSVAKEMVRLLHSNVPESDFPSGILCFSDGCFNHSGTNKTETKVFMDNLKNGGFSAAFRKKFKIVLWDIPNGYYGGSQTAFEDYADTPNLFHISGLDPASVAFITGTKHQKSTPMTSEELFKAAMDQEVLNMTKI